MSESEEGVRSFIVRELCVQPEGIVPETCLVRDLGMDGDDAVEFFEKFRVDFQVDLTVLEEHGGEHFLPEGRQPSLGCMVLIGAATIIGSVVHQVFPVIPMLVWTMALCVVFLCVYTSLTQAPLEKEPMRVQDLVDAVEAGVWVRKYQARAKLFQTLG